MIQFSAHEVAQQPRSISDWSHGDKSVLINYRKQLNTATRAGFQAALDHMGTDLSP